MTSARTKRAGRIATALGLFLLLELLVILTVDRQLSLDLRRLEALHPALFAVFHAYTDLGKSIWYLIPSGIGIILCAIAVRWQRVPTLWRARLTLLGHRLVFLFCAVAASGLLTDAIKPFVGRARPVELQREGLFGFYPVNFHAAFNSLPSGHATTAFTLMTLGILWFPRWRVLAITLGTLLAASRVLVNAHYLADVLAGGMVGILTVVMLQRLTDKTGIFPVFSKLIPPHGLFPIDKETAPRP